MVEFLEEVDEGDVKWDFDPVDLTKHMMTSDRGDFWA